MTQAEGLVKLSSRGYEDYVSMKKAIKAHKTPTCIESIFHFFQTSPTSATAVDISQKGGLTITQKASTAISIFLAADTDSGDYDNQSVTGHYFTNAGVKKNFTIAFNTTNTTEVAGPTDFYCWNLEDYTAATVLVSSVAASVGENIYIGETGMVAGAEKRLATIAAGATYPVITTLYGAGDVYGAEEADTAGDVGKVITVSYWTPWGQRKTGSFTLAATTTDIVRLTDTTTGLVVVDFYRLYTMTTTAVTGKYVCIGYDADKRAGTVALDAFYGVIEEANWQSIHSRLMAPGAAYGKLYLGDLRACNNNAAKIAILYVTYTAKGEIARTHYASFMGTTQYHYDYCIELEPLSEVTLALADDAATPVVCGVILRSILSEVS